MTQDILQALRRRTNHRGLVIVRESVLLGETHTDAAQLNAALRELEKAGTIEILSPRPFLAMKLKKWPAEPSESANSPQNAYSYSKQLFNQEQLKDSYRPDEIAANEGLLQEILETLGETDAASFRKAVENYAPYVIRTALLRVRRAKNIRKNRTALFRHLLPRIAQESQHSK